MEGAAEAEEGEGGAAACGRAQFMAAVRRQDPLARLGLELDEALLDLILPLTLTLTPNPNPNPNPNAGPNPNFNPNPKPRPRPRP